MKFIEKKPSPDFFESWKNQFNILKGRSALFSDLIGKEKQDLKNHLMQEQFKLCCYCCNRIEPYNSHIEHLKPKGNPSYANLQLDYDNLLVSCEGYKDNRKNCGHKKFQWYDAYYMISPLDPACESLFEFTIDGRVKPSHNDTRAIKTIEELDLDSDLLRRARKTAIYLSGLFDEDFVEHKKQYIDEYVTPDNNELKPFCNAIVYCMTHY